MNSELVEKTERLQRMLETESLGAVLINSQHNFAWLTCGGTNGIDLSRENGAGFLLVMRDGKRCVIANNIELHRLVEEELPPDEFEPIQVEWQAERDPQTILGKVRALTSGEIGCDVGFPETRWIEPSIASCRAQLTPEEIARYRTVGQDAGKALENATTVIEPGHNENQIARIVRDELAARGLYSIVTLVAADDRIRKYRHPIPTGNTWRQTLMIVTCARRAGLIANLTRIICVGDVPADLQKRTEAAAFVNASLYDATAEGAMASQLYKIAADAYAEQGFADEINKHHQGGATGYKARDWVAHPDGNDVVKMNQAFAWNPSITGTKTEETGILTPQGFEVITATDGIPKISTVINGTEYFSPGILSLSKGASA